MSNEYDAKMDLPAFVKIKIHAKGNDKEYLLKARINPFHISSYWESAIKVQNEDVPITCVIVGSERYNVDMTIEEFDEMIKNIDRGLSIK